MSTYSPSESQSLDYSEVTTCPVCKHDGFCRAAETPDGQFIKVLCRRKSEGGKRGVYADGTEYWTHTLNKDGSRVSVSPGKGGARRESLPKYEVDTRKFRHAVYEKLLSHLALLHEDHVNLRKRGFDDETIVKSECRSVARGIGKNAASKLVEEFGERVLTEVPGFYKNKEGNPTFSVYVPALLVPVRDPDGSIIALKARKKKVKQGEQRYFYVSSKKHKGAGSGAPSHFPLGFRPAWRIRTTEGELKANITHALDPEKIPTFSIPGVGSHEQAVEALDQWECSTVHVAFDMDANENEHVRNALNRFCRNLQHAGYKVFVESWDPQYKGIDDALAAGVEIKAEPFVVTPDMVIREDSSEIEPEDEAQAFLDDGAHDDHFTLRYWKGSFWLWRRGAFRAVSYEDVRVLVMTWLRSRYEKVTPYHVTTTIEHIKASAYVSSFDEAPTWLGESPKPEWSLDDCFLTSQAILHLPTFTKDPAAGAIKATPQLFNLAASGGDISPEELQNQEPVEWLKFLESVWEDDAESAYALQRWFGYVLTPRTDLHKILFIVGPRRSGKSTIFRILRQLVGPDNTVATTLESITQRFGLEPFLGKTVALISDARLSGRTDAAVIAERLLSISGEDATAIDMKHKAAITARLQTRICLASNELPNLKDASTALASRFLILKMKKSFLGREDLELEGRLLQELPYIAGWAIQGWKDLQRERCLLQPESGQEAMDELTRISAPVVSFVTDECFLGEGERIEKDELFGKYLTWCDFNGIKYRQPLSMFVKDLRAAYPQIEITRPRIGGHRLNLLNGIGCKSPFDEGE